MRVSSLLKTSAIAALLIAGLSVFSLNSFNHFDVVENLIDPSCQPVTGIAGPEDLQIDHEKGWVYISSFDRRPQKDDDGEAKRRRGAIHVAALDDPLKSSAWRDRTGGRPDVFEPLGLSLFDDGETKRLFVVNAATNAVEVYDVDENGNLDHLKSITERRLTSINDVAAIGPEEFYVTNDLAPGRTTLLGKLQYFTRAATGTLFHYDGQFWSVAAQDLRFANGVVVERTGRRLYLTESSAMALRIYDRDPERGVLALSQVVNLPAAAENLNIADDGAILIGANPKPLTLGLHRRSSKVRSPSLVLRYRDEVIDTRGAVLDAMDTTNTKPWGQKQTPLGSGLVKVYQSDGKHLSAATVADASGGKFVIGALVDDRYLICQLK